MREIRFRAWDKFNKTMMPVASIHFKRYEFCRTPGDYKHEPTKRCLGVGDFPCPCPTMEDHYCLGVEGILSESHISSNCSCWYEIMQFTGLRDNAGKEIYEGDIVRDIDGEVYFVEYSSPYFACYKPGPHGNLRETHFYDLSVEVIGNIYENPELLK